ncbi:MAG: DNA primase, partial [Desulfovibrionaceae bacterium]|nr:DNA primase [Desulfovibrionaceae bacterium]
GRWMGPCPFHQETKPSFSVKEDEGFYYCFGCQACGDVIDFYMRINGLEFQDALEQLAAEAGVELGRVARDPAAAEKRERKKVLLAMHEQARDFFCRNLRLAAGAGARQYLAGRGVSPETVEAFGLGYSLDEWQGLERFLRGKGLDSDLGLEAGLLTRNEKGNVYDRFRGRLMFPIQNLSGQVIAFGARIITQGEPKYLNSSDSPIYKKGEHLYGLYQARRAITRTRRALLTEGYLDVLSMHQFGYQDACGVLGTALTNDQVRRLSGLCSRVDLVFDGDSAGRKAALRSSEMLLRQGVSCRVVLLPEGEDVDSLLQAKGREGFEKCLDKALDGLAFCLSTVRGHFSPKEVVAWAGDFMDGLADPGLLAYFIPKLSAGLGLSEAELRQRMGRARTARAAAAPGPADRPAEREDKRDRQLLRFAIQYPEFVAELEAEGFEVLLTGDWARDLWRKMVSRRGEDILPWLDETQKALWTSCRLDLDGAGLSPEDRIRERDLMVGLVRKARQESHRKDIKDALRRHWESGDREKGLDCIRALHESIWRDDEQH